MRVSLRAKKVMGCTAHSVFKISFFFNKYLCCLLLLLILKKSIEIRRKSKTPKQCIINNKCTIQHSLFRAKQVLLEAFEESSKIKYSGFRL